MSEGLGATSWELRARNAASPVWWIANTVVSRYTSEMTGALVILLIVVVLWAASKAVARIPKP